MGFGSQPVTLGMTSSHSPVHQLQEGRHLLLQSTVHSVYNPTDPTMIRQELSEEGLGVTGT